MNWKGVGRFAKDIALIVVGVGLDQAVRSWVSQRVRKYYDAREPKPEEKNNETVSTEEQKKEGQ